MFIFHLIFLCRYFFWTETVENFWVFVSTLGIPVDCSFSFLFIEFSFVFCWKAFGLNFVISVCNSLAKYSACSFHLRFWSIISTRYFIIQSLYCYLQDHFWADHSMAIYYILRMEQNRFYGNFLLLNQEIRVAQSFWIVTFRRFQSLSL